MAIVGDKRGVSRREALKQGAITTGSLAAVGLLAGCVGGTPLSGSDEGSVSGRGFIPTPALNKVESWDSFEVVAAFDGTYDDPLAGERTRTLDQAPRCDDGDPVTFQGHRIRRVGSDGTDRRDIAILFIGPNLTVPTEVALVLTDVESGCRGVLHGGGKGTHKEDTSKVSFESA